MWGQPLRPQSQSSHLPIPSLYLLLRGVSTPLAPPPSLTKFSPLDSFPISLASWGQSPPPPPHLSTLSHKALTFRFSPFISRFVGSAPSHPTTPPHPSTFTYKVLTFRFSPFITRFLGSAPSSSSRRRDCTTNSSCFKS